MTRTTRTRERKRSAARLLCAALLLALLPPPAVAADSPESPEKGAGEWQILGAPYIAADSDFGVTLGLAAGVAHVPGFTMITLGSVSTRGLAGGRFEGEATTNNRRLPFRLAFQRARYNLYPPGGVYPDPAFRAYLDRFELRFATLLRHDGGLEFGPEVYVLTSRGLRPEDMDGHSVPLEAFSRFQAGYSAMAGPRIRYRTTSPIRPMDGVILDAVLRGGRSGGDAFSTPRNDWSADLWASWTRPLSGRLRLYTRLWGRLQGEAPPPVRNHLGGGLTVRGQPLMRDYGRRQVLGRAQVHWTLARGIRWPGDLANRLWSALPSWPLDAELVFFADAGAAMDPDEPRWRRTRQGYGVSLHIVLPPELVFRLDIAISPGGPVFFYTGGGESL